MVLNTSSWHERVEKAEHYIQVGQLEQWLFGGNNEDRPWDLVMAVVPDSMTVISGFGTTSPVVPMGVKFVAPHPCGIVFLWSIRLTDPNRTTDATDPKVVRLIRSSLPAEMYPNFKAIIVERNGIIVRLVRESEHYLAELDRQEARAMEVAR